MDPGKYSRRKVSIADEGKEEPEEEIKKAFTKISAGTIAKLIEDEPDAYSIEDVKIRYK